MKHKKHFMTVVCTIAALMLLGTSVYANYDNASGYTTYKSALKNLLMNEDNYTLKANMKVSFDGKVLEEMSGDVKADGIKSSSHSVSKTSTGAEVNESYNYDDGKKHYGYDPVNNSYYSYDSAGNSPIIDMNDKTVSKTINFMELAADAFIGDLKNNFVLESNNDGIRTYNINVTSSQMPKVIDAGISLMFTTLNNQSYDMNGDIEYENYDKTYGEFYMQKTGVDWKTIDYSNYTDEQWDEDSKIDEEFTKAANDMIEQHDYKGVVYVNLDGSLTYYSTPEEYKSAHPDQTISNDEMLKMLGTEPVLSNVTCTFSVDKDNQLLTNTGSATLTGTGSDGVTHSLTMEFSLDISDYGTTTADVFDPSGKTEEVY